MRIPRVILGLALVAAACSGSSSSTTSTTTLQATTTVASPPTETTSSLPPTTTLPESTTTSSTSVSPIADAICDPYLDYLAAFDRSQELDALRRFDIALGILRPAADALAISVLRDRPWDASVSAAEGRATLISNYGPACGEPGAGYRGNFDRLLTAGVIVAGSGVVQLLDGTLLIAEDPAGSYVDAFGGRNGGLVALEEIGGLEVIEYRRGISDIPRDLALNPDMRLHDTAILDGIDHAVVTTWEAAGEFGEGVQYLDLFPLDGSDPRRIGVVGTATAAAETVSYAGGYFVVTEVFVGGSDIYALSLDGERQDVPGLPLIDDGSPGVSTLPLQRARVDPLGEKFAYLHVTPGAEAEGVEVIETELVIQRLDDGGEELRLTIGGRDQVFTSLDYDGHWVAAARADKLVVVDTWAEDGPELSELSVGGIVAARFLDDPLVIFP